MDLHTSASTCAMNPLPNYPISTLSQANLSVSSIRRKPPITYRSPSVHVPVDLRIENSAAVITVSRSLTQEIASSSASTTHFDGVKILSSERVRQVTGKKNLKGTADRKKYPMHPPLPLYHPLGRLALSLPPLDPTTLGLPVPLRRDESGRRSSARARRPAAKVREAQEDSGSTPVVVDVPREAKEKASSPRKKRTSGGGGTKRRRREVDDGDATYPAKRTRNPRGGVVAGEPDSPTESVSATVDPGTEVVVEMLEEEEKRPERRTTRSRGALTRRGSSASEATSISVSVFAGGVLPGGADSRDEFREGNAQEAKYEKEDGEVSEEAQMVVVY